MKKWLKLSMIATALALVSVLAFSVSAFAQGSGPGPARQGTPSANGPGYGSGMLNRGAPQQSLLAVAADVLGMSQADLVAELDDKTIAQVAQARGVATNTIVDAFLAPRVTALQNAVSAGRLTQAQADQMLATMKANVTAQLTSAWTPRGPGQGSGFVDANHDGICDYQQ